MNVKIWKTIVLCVFIYIIYYYVYDGTIEHRTTINGIPEVYRVRRGNESQLRADLLGVIKLKLSIIVDNLEKDSNFNMLTSVQRLVHLWKLGVGIKEIGNLEFDAAYVINKRNMSFCLRTSPFGGKLEELNLITYVAIHELAHIMSVEIGHGTEFKKNFEFLLNYAKNLTYYSPFEKTVVPLYVDIKVKNPTNSGYCGVNIDNNAIS
jgi:hypothetical protein